MQNPAFWARLGLLWCLFIFATCWCASTKAATSNLSGSAADQSIAVLAEPLDSVTTTLAVSNSQAGATHARAANGLVAYAIPTLDGFGLFLLAGLFGLAALWLRRRE
jgi:IPTL-CTERM motif